MFLFFKIDPIKSKKDDNSPRNNNLVKTNESNKDDHSLPIITQSFSISNDPSSKFNKDSDNLKLPNINTSRSYNSRSSHSKPNKVVIPSRRYYDPGYKRCPCLMHNRMYYKGGKPPPEEEVSYSHFLLSLLLYIFNTNANLFYVNLVVRY